MCDQGIKAADEMRIASSGTPANHVSVPLATEQLIKEIECVIKRNPQEKYLRILLSCALAYEKAMR